VRVNDADELVILVDDRDTAIGVAPKLEVHRTGALHRAFSVFLRDAEGRLLLQRRAFGKYHSGGRWANTCCGHPRSGELVHEAARRRLNEEMGVDCDLRAAGSFLYRADVGAGLVEHELDHLFVGQFDGVPSPEENEVVEWQWVSPSDIELDLIANPERYAAWFAPALAALQRSGTLK
jgi:isopentenyl-diphosphate delta-isomerase